MPNHLVSIIIPTYNRAHLLIAAIGSARAQTYEPTQIIVIDDGSTDDTRRVVTAIEGVEYFYQPHQGQGAARNHGLRQARGRYIASLDSDDLWNPDFLRLSVEALERFELDFVFSNWWKVRDGVARPSEWLAHGKWRRYQKHREGEWSLLGPDELRELFLERCPAPSSSLVIRRASIAKGWGVHMLIADEWYMLVAMVLSERRRAAFTLTPHWSKRVDGQNVYDGQPNLENTGKLYLHDYPYFRNDFAKWLTASEKMRMQLRESKYCLYLLLAPALRTRLAFQLRIPLLVSQVRSLLRTIQYQVRNRWNVLSED